MRTIEEHLRERINNAVTQLKLAKGQEELTEFLENGCDEEEFLKNLPQIDLKSLTQDDKTVLRASYDSLKKHKKDDYTNKYMKLLLRIGEKSALELLNQWEYRLNEDFLQRLIGCGASPALVISYYAEDMQKNEYTVSLRFMQFLDKLFEAYEDKFPAAFEMSSVNAKLCLAAFLGGRDAKKYSDYHKYTENSIKVSLKVLLPPTGVSEDDIESAKKYIDGGLFVKDRIVEQLKGVISPGSLNPYILKLLIAIAYLIKETSNIGRRFIKFCILLSYKESFDKLQGFAGDKGIIDVLQSLVDQMNIPEELFIAWMGAGNNYGNYRFKQELAKKAKDKRKDFEKAIKLANNADSTYLSSILWSTGGGDEFLQQAEEKFLDEFLLFMNSINIPTSVTADFIEYMKGNKEFDDVKAVARNVLKNVTGYYYYRTNHLDILFRLNGRSEVFVRAIRLFAAFYDQSMLNSVAGRYKSTSNNRTLKGFLEFLKNCGVEEEAILYYTVESAANSYSAQDVREAREEVHAIVSVNRELAEKILPGSSAQGRVVLLEILFNIDSETGAVTLINYLDDTSKAVKDKIVELLSDYPQCFEKLAPLLSAKKQAVRETVIRILSRINSDEALKLLSNALETEKSEKVRSLISKALNLEESVAVSDQGQDLAEYCKSIIKRSSKAVLNWLDFGTLPKVRLKEKESFAEDEIIVALMIAYASNGTIAVNPEAKVIREVLNERDTAELALQALTRWLEAGAETKKKWVLAFSAVHGDYRTIELLKKNIEEWPLKSRGAIACEAVRALSLNGSNSALIIVDGISRKFKFKQVKEAASVALNFAAEQLGMDKEELSDKIVPTLGFDIRGERTFDYGERKFTAWLTPELALEISDENEKQIKSLPAVGKKDDPEKAAAALEEFKNLKKQLKNTVSIQSMRLELALSASRLWNKEAWTNLFVENPIMHQFATALIWGVYENGELKDTFRYMEDGSFNTKDEEEYELQEEAKISLVHPIELSEEDRDLWKEQLENYEIKQPFEQINRAIYKVAEEEKQGKSVERFGGIIINSLSLLGKITAQGWYRGSVVDAGGYYTFYKEDKNLSIGAELEFSGTCVGMEGEEVTIYGITFYKAGTVERGSYVYDSVKEQNLIKPGEVPERFFSEILYSVDKSLASKIGIDENWKKKK